MNAELNSQAMARRQEGYEMTEFTPMMWILLVAVSFVLIVAALTAAL